MSKSSQLSSRQHEYAEAYLSVKANMLAYLRKRLDTPDMAEDIVHDAFVKALAHKQERQINNVNAWLMRIMQNAVADYYRSNAGKSAFDEPDQSDDLASDSDAIEVHHLFAQFLRPFVDGLPSIYAEAIVMKDYEGQSIKVMAQSLGISQSAVKSRVSRGRKMLQNALLACCKIELQSGLVSDFMPRRCI